MTARLMDLTSLNPGGWVQAERENSYGWDAFSFPDGQPHLSVRSAVGNGFSPKLRIRARIASSDDLVRLLLARDCIRKISASINVSLELAYVMGARMDRAMPQDDKGTHPFTLDVIAKMIKTADWHQIKVFDPHSDVLPALLGATVVLPVPQVMEAIQQISGDDVVLVAPDAGAEKRVLQMAETIRKHWPVRTDLQVVQGTKHRDQATGKLSGFGLQDPDGLVKDKHCLIVDDLCDGGGTFVGLAEVLRTAGAASVHLYTSHGVFSKGYSLAGIDKIFTTDSYRPITDAPEHVKVLRWG